MSDICVGQTVAVLPKLRLEGNLEKQGRLQTWTWKTYYFILEDDQLSYYKVKDDKASVSARNKPHIVRRQVRDNQCLSLSSQGLVSLCLAQTVKPCKDISRGFPFEIITKSRSYVLSAESADLRDEWVKILQQAMLLKKRRSHVLTSWASCHSISDEEIDNDKDVLREAEAAGDTRDSVYVDNELYARSPTPCREEGMDAQMVENDVYARVDDLHKESGDRTMATCELKSGSKWYITNDKREEIENNNTVKSKSCVGVENEGEMVENDLYGKGSSLQGETWAQNDRSRRGQSGQREQQMPSSVHPHMEQDSHKVDNELYSQCREGCLDSEQRSSPKHRSPPGSSTSTVRQYGTSGGQSLMRSPEGRLTSSGEIIEPYAEVSEQDLTTLLGERHSGVVMRPSLENSIDRKNSDRNFYDECRPDCESKGSDHEAVSTERPHPGEVEAGVEDEGESLYEEYQVDCNFTPIAPLTNPRLELTWNSSFDEIKTFIAMNRGPSELYSVPRKSERGGEAIAKLKSFLQQLDDEN